MTAAMERGEGPRGNKEINQPVLGVYEEEGMKKVERWRKYEGDQK